MELEGQNKPCWHCVGEMPKNRTIAQKIANRTSQLLVGRNQEAHLVMLGSQSSLKYIHSQNMRVRCVNKWRMLTLILTPIITWTILIIIGNGKSSTYSNGFHLAWCCPPWQYFSTMNNYRDTQRLSWPTWCSGIWDFSWCFRVIVLCATKTTGTSSSFTTPSGSSSPIKNMTWITAGRKFEASSTNASWNVKFSLWFW